MKLSSLRLVAVVVVGAAAALPRCGAADAALSSTQLFRRRAGTHPEQTAEALNAEVSP
jgi:hypothetical protein